MFFSLNAWALGQQKTRSARGPKSKPFFARLEVAKSTGSPPASMVHTLPLSTHICPPFPHGRLPLQPLQVQFREYFTPQRSIFETNPEACFAPGLCPPPFPHYHVHLQPLQPQFPEYFTPHRNIFETDDIFWFVWRFLKIHVLLLWWCFRQHNGTRCDHTVKSNRS